MQQRRQHLAIHEAHQLAEELAMLAELEHAASASSGAAEYEVFISEAFQVGNARRER